MARHTGNQVESKGVKIMDILRKCGSAKHLKSAFRKMRELCTPGNGILSVSTPLIIAVLGSTHELGSIDKHWYSGLESSGWLHMVRASLNTAKEVTHLLCIKRCSVMLLGKGFLTTNPFLLDWLCVYRGDWL